jgi:hypothetical protein
VKFIRLTATKLVAALLLTASLYAQTADTGALTGTVTDATGAVVPSATVTAVNQGSGLERTTQTAADGHYSIGLLPPGAYRVRFSANGFKTAELGPVTVQVTESPVLNRAMEVGAQTEQITVGASAETVQTSNATLGTVIDTRQVVDLPLNTRNYTNLLALSAGVSSTVNNATALGKGSQDFAVNGAGIGQNNFSMDGVSIQNFGGQGSTHEGGSYTSFGIPSPDALAEFKIQTSQYDAGYGRNPGANVNVVTKSGTNQFHGTAFEFFRNTDLNANDFFLNRAGIGRPVINQNQFGGVIGGPVKKDKLFFFFSYQGTRQTNGASTSTYQPSVILPPIPGGDRSAAGFQAALGAAFCPANHPGNRSYTTAVTSAFGGVQVACDGSNINPVALSMLQAKLPNGSYMIPGSTNGGFQNSPLTVPGTYHDNQYIANADYAINSKNTFSGRFFEASDPQNLAFLPLCSGSCLDGFRDFAQFTNLYGTAKLTTIVSNTIVNELAASFQRNITDDEPRYGITNQQFGITPATPGINQLSPMSISGLFQVGGSIFDNQKLWVNTFLYKDQISWTKGKHTIRFGGEYARVQWPWVFPSIAKGELIIPSFGDFLLGLAGCAAGSFPVSCNGGNPGKTNGTPVSDIIAEVLGNHLTSSNGTVNNFQERSASLFFQDDFKMTSRLTLNLGLRWEYDGMMIDKYGNDTNIWISQLQTVPVPGSSPATGTPAGYVVPSNYNGPPLPAGVLKSGHTSPTQNDAPMDNFAPRLGFAWQPFSTPRFAVRGGAGFFYDLIPGASLVQSVQLEPPYAADATGGPGASLANPWNSNTPGTFPVRWANFATGGSSNLNEVILAQNFLTPLVYSWNLNAQYEFVKDWVLEVGYVGSRGIHQITSGWNFNAPYLASAASPVNGVTANTTSNYLVRVPYLGISENATTEATNGDFKYNSLQATVRKRFSKSLTLQAAYTFSRAFTTGNLASGDPHNIRQQYGLNAQYHPQRITIDYSWDLPFGQHTGLVGKLVNGWNLSGVTTLQDGTPLTINDGSGATIYGLTNSRANMCPGATYGSIATSGDLTSRLGGASGGPGYLNLSAFCAPPSIDGGTGYGNSGIGVLLGPGQFDWDVSLAKTTIVGGINERAMLQFRAEFFNLFNHPQFNNPVGLDVNQPTSFGQITGMSVNPRLIQFALKYAF